MHPTIDHVLKLANIHASLDRRYSLDRVIKFFFILTMMIGKIGSIEKKNRK